MTRKKTDKQTTPRKSHQRLVFEELEPRLLLSADLPVDIPAMLAPDRGDDEPIAVHEEISTTAVTGEQHAAHELVFVDTDTPDYQTLVDDLLGNSGEDRLIEVVLFDNSSDGIAQITDTLSQYKELDAVHIISHGSESAIDLGGTQLEFDTLLANTTAIQGWSEAFSDNGDLLIYGCNLAASADGQVLVDSLARLTGADVAASDDLTGSAEQGGDWELEYHSGLVETSVAVSGQTQQAWKDALAANVNDAPTFDVGDGIVTTDIGSADNIGNGITIQSDGKIIVSGRSFNGSDYDSALVRYNTDGSLDNTFGVGGKLVTDFAGGDDQSISVTMQTDGKILAAGYSDNGSNYDFALVRYNTDGSLDTSFDGDGKLTTAIGTIADIGYSVTVQTDGKILVAGYSANGLDKDFALVRYDSDGTLDTSFSVDGKLTTDFGSNEDIGYSVTVQTDGKILVAGQSKNGAFNDFALARYNTDGSLDSSFSGDGMLTTAIGASAEVGYSVTVQPDGKIMVAGYSHNGVDADFALVRYNTDGTLDTSFSGDGKLTTDFGSGADVGYDVLVQPDGKILVSGFSSNGANQDFALARYNADGSLDTSFSGDGMLTTAIGSGNDAGLNVILQPDGKILVAGQSDNGSNLDIGLVRYNTDGSLDLTFDPVNTLDGNPTFTEGGAPVVLDADVEVYDQELTEADNFDGASLTLVRNGGADAEDLFSATGTLAALTEGGNLVVGGTTIGTVTTNSAGTLLLTFNASATNTLVNQAMQQIAYSNNSDAPPASVQIDWSFDDGNSGAQGTGGALSATGSTTVSITAVNDAPTDVALSSSSVDENTDTTGGYSVGTLNATDVDAGDTHAYTIVGGADAALFAIGGAGSDELILDDGVLDFETQSSYQVTVRVTDSGTPGLTYDETVTITVNDLNETPTDISISNTAVDENVDTTGGYSVGTLSATDVDAGDSHTYSIVGGADAALFTIGGAGSDELILDDGVLDFETQGSYQVTMRVTDSGTPGLTYDELLMITVNDLNETPTDIALSNSNVYENIDTTGGYSVGALSATDVDAVDTNSYSIVGGADAALFSIGGAGSDELILDDGILDFETKSSYQVMVRVTDSGTPGLSYDELLTITVNDQAGNISGTVFTDEGTSNIGAGKTISLLVNGVSVESVVTGAGGAYSFTSEANAGDAVAVFIDNDATYQGITVTVSDGADLGGIQVYANHVVVRNDNGGATSIADMDTALGAYADPDIHYAVVGGNLVANAVGSELLVPAGHTFTPGGDVNVTSIKILGTVNGGSNTFNIAENWNSTPGDWNADTSTVNLLGTGVLLQNTSATPWAHGFNNLSVAAAGQTTTMSSVIWAKQLTTGSGTLTDGASSHALYLQGTGNVFVDGGGTLDFDALHYRVNNATQNVVGRDYSGINNLYFNAVGGIGGNGIYEIQGNIIANDVHVIVNNDGNPGHVRNSIVNTNNFNFTAANLYLGVNGEPEEYATFNAGASTVNISGDVIVYATDANGTSAIDASTSSWTVSGDWANYDTFYAGTSTVVLDGTGALNSTGAFHNLTTGAASQVTTLTSDLTVSNVLTIADATGTLTDAGGGHDITVTGAGTPFVNNGATVTAKNFIYSNANPITITAAGGAYNVSESLWFDSQNTGAGTTFQLNGDLLVTGAGLINVYSSASGLSILDTTVSNHDITASDLHVANSLLQAGLIYANDSTIDINGDVSFSWSANTTIHLGGSVWNVSGNWTNNSTSFNAGTSTVNLDGVNQQIAGSTVFYNLTKVESSNDGTDSTLTFDNTATQTINGTLTLNGLDADDRINLVSDSPGNQWGIILTAMATQAIDYIEVTDSDASGSDISQKYINPAASIDGGNNIDWFGNFEPVTNNASASGNEDAASIAITLTGSDVDGTVGFFRLNGLPANGTLYTDAGLTTPAVTATDYAATAEALTLYFLPNGNWNGVTTFDFVAKDDGGQLDATPATATITVNGVNDAPTDVALSSSSVNENTDTTGGYSIGTLTATDVDAGDAHSYSVVGGADAALFSIGGAGSDELILDDGVLDFETQSSYQVTVRVTDSGTPGLTYDETVTITVNDLNETPTDISISNTAVDENVDTTGGYSVGTLSATDVDAGDSHTYSIVGGADAALFSIGGAGSDELILDDGILDFETQSSYQVTVRVTDSGTPGLTYDETVTITVNDLNEAPTDLALSNSAVDENIDTTGGYSVGTLTGTDVDAGDTQTYTIVGGADAALFTIGGAGSDELILDDGVLDFETQGSYQVTVRVTDSGTPGLTYDETVTITVNDLNEGPTDLSLSNSAVDENTDTTGGYSVGTLSATDVDAGDAHSYSVVGGADAALFSIGGAGSDELILDDGVLDFETQSSYQVTVRVTDSGTPGLTYDETVTVTVNDLNEAPTDINLSNTAVDENVDTTGGYSVGTLTGTDPDAGDTHSYTIIGGADAALFSIGGAGSDELILDDGVLDFETQSSYQVTVRVTDSGTPGLTYDELLTITVNDLNDAPVVNNDSFTVNEGSTTNLNLVTNDMDADDGLDLTSITIVSGPTNGSVVVNADGTVDYTHNGSETISDSFNYTINDASGATSAVGTVNLTIDPVNDAPIHSVPPAQSTSGDTPLIFSSLNANAITVADADAGGAAMEVTLSVSSGTLSLAETTGLSFNVGDGSRDATMTFTGTATDINAALNGLSFQPGAGYEGMATLQIITDDLGNVGSGGALNALGRVNITVTASAPTGISQDTLPTLDELILEDMLDIPAPVPTPVNAVATAAEEARDASSPASGQGSGSVSTPASDSAIDVTLGSGRGVPTQADVSLPGVAEVFDENLQPHDDNRPSSVRLIAHAIRQGLVDPFTYAKMLNPLQPDMAIWESIEAMMEQMDGRDTSWYSDDQVLTTTTTTGLTVSFTVGYISWLLRAGYLSASLMSVLPLWREFDPLPVLAATTRKKTRKSADDGKDSSKTNDIESERLFSSNETS